jgi:hypothetical protein
MANCFHCGYFAAIAANFRVIFMPQKTQMIAISLLAQQPTRGGSRKAKPAKGIHARSYLDALTIFGAR